MRRRVAQCCVRAERERREHPARVRPPPATTAANACPPDASRQPPRAPAGRGTAPLCRCRLHCHRDTAGRNSGWALGTMTASDENSEEGGGRCVRWTDADGGAPLSAAKDLAFAIHVSLRSGGRGEKQSRPGGRRYTIGDILILFATTQEAQRGTQAERERARHLTHMSETSKRASGRSLRLERRGRHVSDIDIAAVFVCVAFIGLSPHDAHGPAAGSRTTCCLARRPRQLPAHKRHHPGPPCPQDGASLQPSAPPFPTIQGRAKDNSSAAATS